MQLPGRVLVLTVLAGCGEVVTFSDAAPGDGPAVDGEVTTGTANVVTYTRTGARALVGGIDIVVTRADGSAGDTALTDASGAATVDVTAGDAVTAVYRTLDGAELVTFAGVEPGDTLTFGGYGQAPASTAVGSMRISFPARAGATEYALHTACGTFEDATGGTTISYTHYSDCASDTFDILIVAYNAEGVLGHGLLEDVAFVDSGVATLAAWEAATSFTMTVTDLPSFVTDANFSVRSTIGGADAIEITANGAPAGGTLTATEPWAPGGDGIVATVFFRRTGELGLQAVLEPLAPTTTQWSLSNPTTLPWLGEAVTSAAAREVTWISEGEGTYDYTLVELRWDLVAPDAGVRDFFWRLVLPPGTDRFELPALGGALADVMPPDDASINTNLGVVDATADAGHDASRARPEWELAAPGEDAAGAIKISVAVFSD